MRQVLNAFPTPSGFCRADSPLPRQSSPCLSLCPCSSLWEDHSASRPPCPWWDPLSAHRAAAPVCRSHPLLSPCPDLVFLHSPRMSPHHTLSLSAYHSPHASQSARAQTPLLSLQLLAPGPRTSLHEHVSWTNPTPMRSLRTWELKSRPRSTAVKPQSQNLTREWAATPRGEPSNSFPEDPNSCHLGGRLPMPPSLDASAWVGSCLPGTQKSKNGGFSLL